MAERKGRSSTDGAKSVGRKSIGPNFAPGKGSRSSRDEKENELNASTVFLEVNDDEAEKRDRRKSRMPEAEERSPSVSPSKESRSPTKSKKSRKSILPGTMRNRIQDTLRNVTHHYSNAQLSDLYTNVIKMSFENKINAKNTWELPLIDVMNDVISAQNAAGGGGMVNFQAASCTLDASVKIYSCRVDATHSEAFKVLGGLTFGNDRPEDDEQDGDGEGDGGAAKEGDDKKKKTKRIPVGGVNTIESNIDKITTQDFDLMFDIDPLFKKTSASFVEGGARGLLLNHLSVYNNCEIIFDSADLVDSATEEASVEQERLCDVSDLQAKLLSIVDDLGPLEICPTFANFRFARPVLEGGRVIEHDSDDLDVDPMMAVNLDEPHPDDDDDDAGGGGFDFEANGDMPMDVDSTAMQQEQNLIDEIGDDNADQVGGRNQTPLRRGRVSEGGGEPDGAGLEFDFVDLKSRNWAGPEHWKYNKPAAAKDEPGVDGVEGAAAAKGRGKKKKEPFYFDFSAPSDVDFEKAFAKPARGGTTLPAKRGADKASSAKNNTLPPDVHYDPKMLTQLFIKPTWRVAMGHRSKRQKGDGGDEFVVPPFGANDDGPGAPFDNDFGGDFGGADFGGGADSDDEHVEFMPPAIATEADLVQAPRKIEKIRVNYAKSAKFVDVRALKETIWTELRDRPAPSDSQESLESDDEDEVAAVPTKTFTTLLNNLPEKVSPDAISNISVPFCFICLLHLANERGLEIDQDQSEQEFGWQRKLDEIFIQKKESA
eukprot:TRINITY_DN6884_c0_g2_i9.p1 TRINITY_DN6884_c0_g2~~TRINITY_DN6884_c0_g2_i9.p1  ORF type:complete len:775 (+),score=240.75 TRINITY_DN6884_c0_g2_i9:22-2325(+)